MKRLATAAVAALALATTGPAFAHDGAEHAAAPAAAATPAVAATRAALRDLWVGHVFWVRNVVDARFAGNAARAGAAEKEVVANAKAIAGAIEPFYGKPASDQLFKLLAGHWQAISAYLDGARAGDTAVTDAAMAKLLGNADVLAEARTWAAMKDHMYVIADALADAIAKQFPDKFR
jgi:hypothetical protein